MKGEKIIEVVRTYGQNLAERGINPGQLKEYAVTAKELPPGAVLEHVAWMCDQTVIFVGEGRMPKANRWLGFIQGVLWASNICSVDELKNANMPDKN